MATNTPSTGFFFAFFDRLSHGVTPVTQNVLPSDSDNPDRKKLDLVVRETTRIESMVREILDFDRPLEL